MSFDTYTQSISLTQKAKFWSNYVSALKGRFLHIKLSSCKALAMQGLRTCTQLIMLTPAPGTPPSPRLCQSIQTWGRSSARLRTRCWAGAGLPHLLPLFFPMLMIGKQLNAYNPFVMVIYILGSTRLDMLMSPSMPISMEPSKLELPVSLKWWTINLKLNSRFVFCFQNQTF